MANITSLTKVGTTSQSAVTAGVKTPVYVWNVIDFADALVAKGSPLAAADTIEALSVPAGHLVKWVGIQLLVPANSTTLTLDVGKTGGDFDEWVDGFDAQGSAAGAFSAYLAADPTYFVPQTTADTIDILFATLTGTLTTGKVKIWAELIDLTNVPSATPGIAQVGS